MRKAVLVIAAICSVTMLGSWGFLVHRTVNQLAVYELPKAMRPFFHRHMAQLVKESVRADERRNSDKTEAPKHFIDFEAYGDSAAWKMPWSWAAAVEKYEKDTLLKYGYVPYVIMDVKAGLTRAFRTQNKDSILFYASDLGHYVGDMHVPLHTTLNYDGQLTNQKGMHSLWESAIPEIELKNYNLFSRHNAGYLRFPEKKIWEGLRRSFSLTGEMFRLETEVSKNFTPEQKYRTQMRNGKEVRSYTSAFARAYSKALGNTVNAQLTSSANLLADLWYTSWVDGGKPDLYLLLDPVYTRAEKDTFNRELKMFKHNTLLRNNRLLSRKNQAGNEE